MLVLVLGALVQATILSPILGAGRPDLVLLLVLSWSILRGSAEGTIGGIAGGLALDLLSGVPFGLHTSLLGLIAALTALGEANLFRGNLPLFVITAALATVALHGGTILILQAAGLQTLTLPRFAQFVVPTALLNALLMPFAFTLFQRAVRALGGWRQLEL
jgi:rod shape-determining protein MreD